MGTAQKHRLRARLAVRVTLRGVKSSLLAARSDESGSGPHPRAFPDCETARHCKSSQWQAGQGCSVACQREE